MFVAVFALNSCTDENEPQNTPFVTFQSTSMDVVFDQGGSSSEAINIYAGNIVSGDRTINVSVDAASTIDGAAYTAPTTVTIPGGTNVGVLNVSFTDVNLSPFSTKSLIFKIAGSDDIYAGGDLALSVGLNCPNNGVKVVVNMSFDNWPEEASWVITDAAGTAVMVGSPNHVAYAGAYANMSSAVANECLPSGTYTLTISDDYADGGTAYTVTGNGVQVVSIAADGYSAGGSVTFSI